MKLYKFRPLGRCKHLKRIKDIIEKGFYCCDFLKFNDMNEGVFTINNINIDIEVLDKQKYKICSFSGRNALNSQLMWGHYANAGMGVAIDVDVNDCSTIEQVKYSNSTEDLNTIEEILTRKSVDWKYEDEYRYLSKNSDSNINIGKITKIYFGTPYENLTNYEKIKDKHENLKKYLKLKGELEKFCKDKSIKCDDYKFN